MFIFMFIILTYNIIQIMTKRAASYDIDPLTYEEKQRSNEKDNPIDPQDSHMRNRKIYKIANRDKLTTVASQSKPTLNIPGFLNAVENKPNQQQDLPILGQSSIFKPSIFSTVSGGEGLFSGIFSSRGEKKENDQGQKKEGASTGNLFGLDNKQKPQSSLFGTSGSLFGSNSQLNSKHTSLWSGTNINIFNNMTSTNKSSLFNNPRPKQQEEEEQGDSAQLERRQTMDVDPSKSNVKFDYHQDCKVLKSVKLSKLKKDKGQLIDNPMKMSLLEDRTGKVFYIVVQLLATHTSIFSGLILPGKSQVRILNSKTENLEIVAFTIANKEKKLQRHTMKVQIINQTEEDSKDFLGHLKQVIEGKQEEKDE